MRRSLIFLEEMLLGKSQIWEQSFRTKRRDIKEKKIKEIKGEVGTKSGYVIKCDDYEESYG